MQPSHSLLRVFLGFIGGPPLLPSFLPSSPQSLLDVSKRRLEPWSGLGTTHPSCYLPAIPAADLLVNEWVTQLYTHRVACNKNFILKYFRCRDGKRTETRIGMEGICITHSCIPLYTVYMQHIMAHSGGMQEWVIQIPSIPILVSVLFPSVKIFSYMFF